MQQLKSSAKVKSAGTNSLADWPARFRSISLNRSEETNLSSLWRKWLSRRKRGRPYPWEQFRRLLEHYRLPNSLVIFGAGLSLLWMILSPPQTWMQAGLGLALGLVLAVSMLLAGKSLAGRWGGFGGAGRSRGDSLRHAGAVLPLRQDAALHKGGHRGGHRPRGGGPAGPG